MTSDTAPRRHLLREDGRTFPLKDLLRGNLKRRSAPRYAVYVVRPDGLVRGVDLGPATEIDESVARFRQSLALHLNGANQHARTVLDYLRSGGPSAHPHFWAPFVVSGDDTPMVRIPPSRTASRRADRGCQVGRSAAAWWLWWLVVSVLAVRERDWYRLRE